MKSEETQARPGPGDLPTIAPAVEGLRSLDIFAFDPTQAHRFGNQITVEVPREPLEPGPVGAQVAVIDYDTSNDCYYRAVDLEHECHLRRGGLRPTEADPRFHQQMAYAAVMQTVDRFELALGREVEWLWHRPRANASANRLRVLPHAMQEPNAYYDRRLRGLFFGYFKAPDDSVGGNLPGQVVFTCLSHDIVVHETTHALLDSVRPYFLEPTSWDTAAFHEAFGDIVAMLQHFSHRDALIETIRRTQGRIYGRLLAPDILPESDDAQISAEASVANPLVDLARQFGEALGSRAALRSALGTRRRLSSHSEPPEPHDRGSLLVAAVFDAYFTVYVRRTRDLMRLARAGGALSDDGDLHPDLANRLATEATKTARHFEAICMRALDYCPPVALSLGDFLRAMVTSDSALVPRDTWGYRSALVDAFRDRGIYPADVRSMSEGNLRWPAPQLVCDGLVADDRTATRDRLHAFADANRGALGLDAETPLIVRASSIAFSELIDPDDGRPWVRIVAQVLQKRRVPLFPDHGDSPLIRFWGGSTVVMDADGTVAAVAAQPVDDDDRLTRHREYLWDRAISQPAAAFTDYALPTASVAAVHRGY